MDNELANLEISGYLFDRIPQFDPNVLMHAPLPEDDDLETSEQITHDDTATGLSIDKELRRFVDDELISRSTFWSENDARQRENSMDNRAENDVPTPSGSAPLVVSESATRSPHVPQLATIQPLNAPSTSEPGESEIYAPVVYDNIAAFGPSARDDSNIGRDDTLSPSNIGRNNVAADEPMNSTLARSTNATPLSIADSTSATTITGISASSPPRRNDLDRATRTGSTGSTSEQIIDDRRRSSVASTSGGVGSGGGGGGGGGGRKTAGVSSKALKKRKKSPKSKQFVDVFDTESDADDRFDRGIDPAIPPIAKIRKTSSARRNVSFAENANGSAVDATRISDASSSALNSKTSTVVKKISPPVARKQPRAKVSKLLLRRLPGEDSFETVVPRKTEKRSQRDVEVGVTRPVTHPRNKKSISKARPTDVYYEAFIQANVYGLLYALAKMYKESTEPRSPTIARTLKHAFDVAHTMTPSIAFKGQLPTSQAQAVRNMRALYFRKVDILMRVIMSLHDNEVRAFDLRNILSAFESDSVIVGRPIITQAATNRTIDCALRTITSWNDAYFRRFRPLPRVSADARRLMRQLCDFFVTNLIRQAHVHQLSAGCTARLLPQHFVAVNLERRNKTYRANESVQELADPVSTPSYLRCGNKVRVISPKDKDIPYDVNALRHVIRANCFMSVQNGKASLRFLNAKIMDAVVHTLAYAITLMTSKRMRAPELAKSRKSSEKTHESAEGRKSIVETGRTLQASDVSWAVYELYGFRLLDDLDEKTNDATISARSTATLDEIDTIALTKLRDIHATLNKVMIGMMVRKDTRRRLSERHLLNASKAYDNPKVGKPMI